MPQDSALPQALLLPSEVLLLRTLLAEGVLPVVRLAPMQEAHATLLTRGHCHAGRPVQRAPSASAQRPCPR